MRKLLFIALLFTAWVNAQQLDPPRTGKDSVSIETSLVVMTEKFTTAEIYAFTRLGGEKPAYVFNSDTETIWAWTGTSWKDLGLAPASGGITIDPTIQNGSTNPVENNAVYDRLLSVVDHDPQSPIQDVTIFKGTKAQFEAAKASLGADYLAIVTDSIYDPSPSGSGIDGYISNVVVSDNNMTFTGQGGAFNGTVSLPSSGGGTDDQILSQLNFNNTTYLLTAGIEDGNNLSTSLAKLWQDATDVDFDDTNVPVPANDVQEMFEDMFASGSGTETVLIAEEWNNSVTDTGLLSYEWERVGSIVHFSAKLDINISVISPGSDYNIGGRFVVSLPNVNGGVPLPTTNLSQPNNILTAGRLAFNSLPGVDERAWCYVRGSGDSTSTDIYLNYAALIPQNFNITGTYTVHITGTYRTRDFQ
jgi:hypothetical protein